VALPKAQVLPDPRAALPWASTKQEPELQQQSLAAHAQRLDMPGCSTSNPLIPVHACRPDETPVAEQDPRLAGLKRRMGVAAPPDQGVATGVLPSGLCAPVSVSGGPCCFAGSAVPMDVSHPPTLGIGLKIL
jgi:hypothetical protein